MFKLSTALDRCSQGLSLSSLQVYIIIIIVVVVVVVVVVIIIIIIIIIVYFYAFYSDYCPINFYYFSI